MTERQQRQPAPSFEQIRIDCMNAAVAMLCAGKISEQFSVTEVAETLETWVHMSWSERDRIRQHAALSERNQQQHERSLADAEVIRQYVAEQELLRAQQDGHVDSNETDDVETESGTGTNG